jgi:hypothetical protein
MSVRCQAKCYVFSQVGGLTWINQTAESRGQMRYSILALESGYCGAKPSQRRRGQIAPQKTKPLDESPKIRNTSGQGDATSAAAPSNRAESSEKCREPARGATQSSAAEGNCGCEQEEAVAAPIPVNDHRNRWKWCRAGCSILGVPQYTENQGLAAE